jgi:hypothetical protein
LLLWQPSCESLWRFSSTVLCYCSRECWESLPSSKWTEGVSNSVTSCQNPLKNVLESCQNPSTT